MLSQEASCKLDGIVSLIHKDTGGKNKVINIQ